MELPTWFTKLLLFASILTAIVTPLAGIKPVYGIIATGIAGLIGAFGDGFKSYIASKGVTFAGLILTASVITLYIASPDNAAIWGWIGPAKLNVLGQLGVIFATVGRKLQGEDVPDGPGFARYNH